MKQISEITQRHAAQPEVEDDEIDLMALAGALLGGWKWIALAFALAVILGAFVALRKPVVYEANGLLQLEQSQNGLSALPESMQTLLGSDVGGKSQAETQIAIMSSRLVLGDAANKLDLQNFVIPRRLPLIGMLPANLHLPDPGLFTQYQWNAETVQIGKLKVPAQWQGEPMTLTVTGADSYRVTLLDGTEVSGTVGHEVTARDGDFALALSEMDAPVGREFYIGRRSLNATIQAMRENFSVSESPRGSNILHTAYQDTDRQRAEKILNAIAASFVDQNIERNSASAENSLEFIQKQLPEARKNVSEAEQALNAYRQKQKSVDVKYETQALLERVTKIEGELSALDLKEAELKNQYTVNHPAYQALLQNRKELQAQLEQAKKATQGLPETQKDIFNLQRNLEVAQQVYTQLLNRSQELQVVRASTVGSVRVIDKAYASIIPVAPRKSRIVALAGILGLIIGAAYVLIRRALRHGIKGAEEIEALGLPVFATVPFAKEASDLRHRKGDLPIFALEHSDAVTTEALRSLRTSLHFGLLDAQTNSIQVTSAAPGVGKTFLSINLAVVAAQAGQRVCLIDADMRKGYLARFLHLPKTVEGLSDYLGHEKALEEVMRDGPVEGLKVITSGRYPPNPSELLMRAEFGTMLRQLDSEFDLIIVDAPPALAVTDPVVIGRSVGASIVIARHLETMQGAVRAVQASFEAAGTSITGAVLNGFKAEAAERYGGHYQYHYNYRYSYKSDD
ncbi:MULTISPECIES: polysaccharide biosynthesis tyrosine autokinase [Thioclava]|uniref:polysaccharide biosynthesis tyrosine autokinase n=1 Tax=Thioclava TaxID=285107 RepID=UPI000B542CAE|nr:MULTISPECIES: polysaccharide biosynthesis tyrosine autokinase [Thioclava]OWY05099.1 acetyltransferase [Thioclava sp. F1Mire-8]OWY09021.1 acetyltransferase [Thioclava sp. F42-5]OWY18373.1 acetyltransferase [Thioclava sp. JM3]WGT50246.1 polysaccharide biosynthesis tyrosine autokinase [Thioclava nitratireducens]